MEQYIVTGMSCAACQARVEKAVEKVPGVTSVSVSLLTNSMGVEGNADAQAVIKAVEDAGYGAGLKADPGKQKNFSHSAEEEALRDKETPKLRRRLVLSVIFLLVLMYLTMGHHMLGLPLPGVLMHNHLGLTLTQMLLALIVMIINNRFFVNGFNSLLHGAPNMDTLVALGSSVSFGWSLYVFYLMSVQITHGVSNMELMDLYQNQLYFESAAMIPALITVGKMLEAMSKGKTTDALKSLLQLAPKKARLVRDGAEEEVDIEEVVPGDIFVVRPGEAIPVDGIVLEGESAVDESALTGESIPVDKAKDDKVSAATINRSGFLSCRATRVGEDTTLSQIIRMVSDAAATKAKIARIADRVSYVFVPTVIGIALLVLIGWLIAGENLASALERAICVLVISCPCALGLATPVAIMVANGLGARNGILFKTSEALEEAGKMQVVVLDKTGTITSGQPVVTDVIPADGITEDMLLETACSLEVKSEHPLAKAVVAYCGDKGMTGTGLSLFKALPGNGLTGKADENTFYGGNASYISGVAEIPEGLRKQATALSEQGKTPLYFAMDDRLLGVIAVADTLKEDSMEGIRQLKDLGLRVVMLTGDNAKTAAYIGKKAGVDSWIADVLPDGKEAVIRTLQEKWKVAMVGDGINDAPALTRADIGIAIGAGTDVAVDSADIVLMNNSIADVAAAVRLSRQTLLNIKENLFWAFFYNLICIPLAAGLFVWKMNPMIGAAAMSLSSFTVCMNALRLNLFRIRDKSHDRPLKNRIEETEELFSGSVSDTKEDKNEKCCIIEKEKAGPGQTQENRIGTERMDKMETTVKVDGMMCAHCEANVKKALEELPFVETAAADHEAGEVKLTLCGEMDENAVQNVITEKGYTYQGLK
ncbi:MAG: heavy metal translocating P-type ATPase [Lachnospiraceae bacterium]|nr:heavy metal translocating P-type ATPase [Lachnospiraceae bacterium]